MVRPKGSLYGVTVEMSGLLSLPIALVISNSPILCLTVSAVLAERYRTTSRTWTALIEEPLQAAELVVVDVTSISADAALSILAPALPRARMVMCSLLEEEVCVYAPGREGMRVATALPSLLALSQ